MEFSNINNAIPPADEAAAAACRQRWDAVAKPLKSLGKLEDALIKVAALTGSADIALSPRVLLVVCADNGVVREGVAQSDESVTRKVAQSLHRHTSPVCCMADVAHCRVLPVDVGMAMPVENVRDLRVRAGTGDIARGPAMTREDAEAAIKAGIRLSEEQAAHGVKLLAAGEMGIGNTTTSAAVACALLGLSPEAAAGRGAGLSDRGLARKRAVLKMALAQNRPDARDPLDVLAKVGGLDLAALCGVYLGAAMSRVPVLLDGFISAVAALLAVRLCPRAAGAMLASHVSTEPAAAAVLNALSLSPLLCAGMHLGEGTGAVAAMPLLDMALAVYDTAGSFAQIGVAPYTPQEGALCTRS